jgi:hypothetical protein
VDQGTVLGVFRIGSTPNYRPSHSPQQRTRISLPYIHPAKELIHHPWRRHISAPSRTLPDLCASWGRLVRRSAAPPRPVSPWAQRMIQLQLALLYFVTFLIKMIRASWVQGTALFYVYHLDGFRRFPLPSWLFYPTLLKLGSWLVRACAGILSRSFDLGEGVPLSLLAIGVFHLSLEYSLNMPLFQWDVLSAYVLFVDPNDSRRTRNCAGLPPAT